MPRTRQKLTEPVEGFELRKANEWSHGEYICQARVNDPLGVGDGNVDGKKACGKKYTTKTGAEKHGWTHNKPKDTHSGTITGKEVRELAQLVRDGDITTSALLRELEDIARDVDGLHNGTLAEKARNYDTIIEVLSKDPGVMKAVKHATTA